MTGRAVFGDFLDAARSHLGTAERLRGTAGGDVDIHEVSRSLLRLVRIMGQYVQDVTAGWGPEPPWPRRRVLTGWTRAGVDAREAIGNAAAFLNEPNARRRRPRAVRGELARHLDAAAGALTAGRDLLQTHLATDPRGERQFRSEWGLVVTSPPSPGRYCPR